MSVMFKPLKSDRFFEKVLESIQREILVGNLQPGQKLPNETELARQFNVGRSAVREALKILELSGLLIVRRGFNGGTFVRVPEEDHLASTPVAFPALDSVSLDQIMEARRTIELKTAALAATRATTSEILNLRRLVGRMRSSLHIPAKLIAADVDFHSAVAEAARNDVFYLTINSIRTALKHTTNKLVVQVGAPEETLRDHTEILKGIQERDPAEAARAMGVHLDHIESRLWTSADEANQG